MLRDDVVEHYAEKQVVRGSERQLLGMVVGTRKDTRDVLVCLSEYIHGAAARDKGRFYLTSLRSRSLQQEAHGRIWAINAATV